MKFKTWSNGVEHTRSLRQPKRPIPTPTPTDLALYSSGLPTNGENFREQTSMRMSQREIFGQIQMNPFLVGSNYLADIDVQNQFLKPMDTNPDRVKSAT